jgi:hypothetical protein
MNWHLAAFLFGFTSSFSFLSITWLLSKNAALAS